jgi:rRNA maturation RNase YbeY
VLNQVWIDHDAFPANVEVNFVGEDDIRALHRDFLQDDSATDVITFDLGPAPEGWRIAVIAICLPVAQLYAEQYHVSLRQELLRLIVHAALHLLGYDDRTTAGKRQMRYHENKILRRIKKLELFSESFH